MVRLQKFLADAAVASRRASERLIAEGRVSVNGVPAAELGTKVDPAKDEVTVDGAPIKARRKLYVALNKPKGFVCSRKDEHDRATVFDLLPKEWAHLHPVGRLDYATEGLLFLTNDGNFSLHLTHPRYGVNKIYQVTVEGRVDAAVPEKFVRGVWNQGEKLRAAKAVIISASNAQSVLELHLTEGKNREVRRLCETERLTVKKLRRTQVGKIKLGELREGKWRTLTEPEIKSLLC